MMWADGKTQRYPLTGHKKIFGASPDCDVQITGHKVAQRHFEISYQADGRFLL